MTGSMPFNQRQILRRRKTLLIILVGIQRRKTVLIFHAIPSLWLKKISGIEYVRQQSIHCGKGYVELVKILAPLTDNPNAPDKHGNTPIYWAAVCGNTEIAKILAPLSDNINASDILHFIVQNIMDIPKLSKS